MKPDKENLNIEVERHQNHYIPIDANQASQKQNPLKKHRDRTYQNNEHESL